MNSPETKTPGPEGVPEPRGKENRHANDKLILSNPGAPENPKIKASEVKKALNAYAKVGSFVLLRPRSKRPVEKKWQGKTPTVEQAADHIAKGGNIGLKPFPGFAVVDVDVRETHDGRELRAQLPLPPTLRQLTPSGGFHEIYRTNGTVRKLGVGIDLVQGSKFIAVWPSSLHPGTGTRYRWDGGEFDAMVIADLPDEFLEVNQPTSSDGTGLFTAPVEEVAELLADIKPAASRETWISVGLAVYGATGGDGFTAWMEWSRRAAGYETDDAQRDNVGAVWASFRDTGLSLPSLLEWAGRQGEADRLRKTGDPARPDARDEFEELDDGTVKPKASVSLAEPADFRFSDNSLSVPVVELPRGLFPKVIEDLAFDQPDTFHPPAVATAAFAVCASMIRRDVKLQVEGGWEERPTFWVALYGRSGTGKSPLLNKASKPGFAYLDEKAREYYNADRERLIELGDTRTQPCFPVFQVTDTTIEGLQNKLAMTNAGTTVYSSELGGVLERADVSYSGQSNREPYLKLYDGDGGYTVVRAQAGRDLGDIKVWRANILGAITTDSLKERLSKAVADGMTARFCYSQVVRTPLTRNKKKRDPEVNATYERMLREIHDAFPTSECRTTDAADENSPSDCPVIPIDEAATDLKDEYDYYWEEQLDRAIGRLSPRVVERISKAQGLMYRAALIFHLIEHASNTGLLGSPRESSVSADTLTRAFEWTKWQVAQDIEFLARLDGATEVPGALRLAERIAGWLLRNPDMKTATYTGVGRGVKSFRPATPEAKIEALNMLWEEGWIVPADGKNISFGGDVRRGIKFRVNPKIHDGRFGQWAEESRAEAEALTSHFPRP